MDRRCLSPSYTPDATPCSSLSLLLLSKNHHWQLIGSGKVVPRFLFEEKRGRRGGGKGREEAKKKDVGDLGRRNVPDRLHNCGLRRWTTADDLRREGEKKKDVGDLGRGDLLGQPHKR